MLEPLGRGTTAVVGTSSNPDEIDVCQLTGAQVRPSVLKETDLRAAISDSRILKSLGIRSAIFDTAPHILNTILEGTVERTLSFRIETDNPCQCGK